MSINRVLLHTLLLLVLIPYSAEAKSLDATLRQCQNKAMKGFRGRFPHYIQRSRTRALDNYAWNIISQSDTITDIVIIDFETPSRDDIIICRDTVIGFDGLCNPPKIYNKEYIEINRNALSKILVMDRATEREINTRYKDELVAYIVLRTKLFRKKRGWTGNSNAFIVPAEYLFPFDELINIP
ncbi:MAG: hypothetical protein IJM35_02230 [Bacteroidales bacterium]|nr:hypothetical protein [Bacteroidales bacterium]